MTLSLIAFAALAQKGGHTMDANGMKAGHTTPSDLAAGANKWVGKAAPAFALRDTKGNATSLKGFRGKPTVLVFIEKNCPCCKGGRPYFDRVQRRYGDVAHVVGVVVASPKEVRDWKVKNGAEFTVLSDAKGDGPRAFGTTSSLFTVLIDKEGTIVRAYPGYSAPMLQELTASIATLAKIKDRKMDTRPAPAEFTSGCPFKG